jgi:ABC-type polysaccharide/polyol phosphate transport system ATPase subunit
MKSRLIFSIATTAKPEILMLDELLSAGDIAFQQKAAKRMDEVITGAHVALVVTHGVGFVLEKCTKALLMAHGKPLYFGSPKIAVSRYFEELHLTALPDVSVAPPAALPIPVHGMFLGSSSI